MTSVRTYRIEAMTTRNAPAPMGEVFTRPRYRTCAKCGARFATYRAKALTCPGHSTQWYGVEFEGIGRKFRGRP